MNLSGLELRQKLAAPYFAVKPELKNNYLDRPFKMVENPMAVLEGIYNAYPSYNTACMLNECKRQMELTASEENTKNGRSYKKHPLLTVDSRNMLVSMGLNAYGAKYTYAGVYDVSNLLGVILSMFFNKDLEEVESKIAKYLVSENIPLFQFVGAYASRWSTFFKGLDVKDLCNIDVSFRVYIEQCYQHYKQDTFEVCGMHLSNKLYSFNAIVNIALECFIVRAQEMILNAIMLEKVRDANQEVHANVVVQSKGIDNVILGTDYKRLLTPMKISYGKYEIELEPTIAVVHSKDVGDYNQLGYAYVEYRTHNSGLLTVGF